MCTMKARIKSSTRWNAARCAGTEKLTGRFASGFKLGLMAKDVGIAAELARGLKLRTPYLKETLRQWRAAEKAMPRNADIAPSAATITGGPRGRRDPPDSGIGLERCPLRLNRSHALDSWFDALSGGEPVSTSPESALVRGAAGPGLALSIQSPN